jgi:hypothetical protein
VVTVTTCPICRKAVFHDDPTTVAARMRGMRETFPLAYFHANCYPGDEGSGFERVERDERDES